MLATGTLADEGAIIIREIRAKHLLAHQKEPDDWFAIQYTMNIYRGCQHQCIYCDSRSECYQIEDFNDVLVKVNAVELLRDELPRKRRKGVIGTGSMSDPYTPVEATYRLTRQCLEIIAQMRYPLHMITKSDMVLRDCDLLSVIAKTLARVSFTLTTVDDELAAIVEPGAPRPSQRLAAMAELGQVGVQVGVTMMPLLPFIEDSEQNVRQIIEAAAATGASYVLIGPGMTLRDRQRAYYYDRLDEHFPALRARYERAFGERYSAMPANARRLSSLATELCEQNGLATRLTPWRAEPDVEQLPLL